MNHFKYQLCVLLSLITIALSGQRDYIKADSSITGGINLLSGNRLVNSKYCQVIKSGSIIKYSPYEVKEYGFSDQRVYKSFNIITDNGEERYFLEMLVNGRIDLFFGKMGKGVEKYFILENDSSELKEIPGIKEEFRVFLMDYVNICQKNNNYLNSVKLNRSVLKRYFNDYNNCSPKPFPRFRYGIITGLSTTRFSVINEENLMGVSDIESLSFSIGLYTDIPVYINNFSVHPEIWFKKTGFSSSYKFAGNDYDIVLNYMSIQLPLLIRYTFLNQKLSPYAEAGVLHSTSLSNIGAIYTYETVDDIVITNITDGQLIRNNLSGFSLGSGLILNYSSKYSLFASLRYNELYRLRVGNDLFRIRDVTFGLGLIF